MLPSLKTSIMIFPIWKNRLEVLVKQEIDDMMEDSKNNCTLVVVGLGPEVSVFSEPADWAATKPKTKTEVGEPQFSEVDNPGGWGEFSFHPKFSAKAKGKDVKRTVHPSRPTNWRNACSS